MLFCSNTFLQPNILWENYVSHFFKNDYNFNVLKIIFVLTLDIYLHAAANNSWSISVCEDTNYIRMLLSWWVWDFSNNPLEQKSRQLENCLSGFDSWHVGYSSILFLIKTSGFKSRCILGNIYGLIFSDYFSFYITPLSSLSLTLCMLDEY